MASQTPVAEMIAALTYGERVAAARAQANHRFAPDERTRKEQARVAEREDENARLIEARLLEIGALEDTEPFRPYFDAFFERTEPTDWLEAQTFHYVGDALVSDLAEVLTGVFDPVSAEIVRRTLGDREDQESFALDELKRAMEADDGAKDRIAAYARRIAGEALTQTIQAMTHTNVLRELLGGMEGEKRLVLDLLDRHRVRMDRLGLEDVEPDGED